jgi:Protein of unknown function (DUF1203)
MTTNFTPLYTAYNAAFVARVREGREDAYGLPAEHAVSDGDGNPCRSCLQMIPAGAEMLILAACPFPEKQPYAETGPIFLCAEHCTPWGQPGVPPVLTSSPEYLVKAYSSDYRIVYGTGRITPVAELDRYVAALLARPGVEFVDIRSAPNNCFATRAWRDAVGPGWA